MKNEAEKKFWRSPELVEELISHLDTGSILTLAKCHQLTLDVLNSGNSAWNKLVSRTCPESIRTPLGHNNHPHPDRTDRELMTTGGVLVREREEMTNLVVILKMLEDPKTRLLAIVAEICRRFVPYEDQHHLALFGGDESSDDDDGEDDVDIQEVYPAQLVQVVDSRNQPSKVSLLGFWLLQEIEENYGGVPLEVKIEGIMIDHLELGVGNKLFFFDNDKFLIVL